MPWTRRASGCETSLPSRGAWIEINDLLERCGQFCVAPLAGSVDRNSLRADGAGVALSLPSRGAWIEIQRFQARDTAMQSLPSRGAWIEIATCLLFCVPTLVAPLAGSVDRNLFVPSVSR